MDTDTTSLEFTLQKVIKVLEKVRSQCGNSEDDVFVRTEIQEALALSRQELGAVSDMRKHAGGSDYSLLEYAQEKL